MKNRLLNTTEPSWHKSLQKALSLVDADYLDALVKDPNWLPGPERLLAAFSQKLSNTTTVLLGESPYPRTLSANGYAFWDDAVGPLFSDKGLSTKVNRATSFRNIMKMLLVAEKALDKADVSQEAISNLDKSAFVQDANGLFNNFLDRGFLLLNASLVLSKRPVNKDAKAWEPFVTSLLDALFALNPKIKLLLFGKIAQKIPQDIITKYDTLIAPHPYNISFIHDEAVIDFFKDKHLLQAPIG